MLPVQWDPDALAPARGGCLAFGFCWDVSLSSSPAPFVSSTSDTSRYVIDVPRAEPRLRLPERFASGTSSDDESSGMAM